MTLNKVILGLFAVIVVIIGVGANTVSAETNSTTSFGYGNKLNTSNDAVNKTFMPIEYSVNNESALNDTFSIVIEGGISASIKNDAKENPVHTNYYDVTVAIKTNDFLVGWKHISNGKGKKTPYRAREGLSEKIVESIAVQNDNLSRSIDALYVAKEYKDFIVGAYYPFRELYYNSIDDGKYTDFRGLFLEVDNGNGYSMKFRTGITETFSHNTFNVRKTFNLAEGLSVYIEGSGGYSPSLSRQSRKEYTGSIGLMLHTN